MFPLKSTSGEWGGSWNISDRLRDNPNLSPCLIGYCQANKVIDVTRLVPDLWITCPICSAVHLEGSETKYQFSLFIKLTSYFFFLMFICLVPTWLQMPEFPGFVYLLVPAALHTFLDVCTGNIYMRNLQKSIINKKVNSLEKYHRD